MPALGRLSGLHCSSAIISFLALGTTIGHAADLKVASPVQSVEAKPAAVFSAEVFGGYLTGIAGEYVYNVPGDASKVSQLNWQIDGAAILGARLGFQPYDWLAIRGSGFTTIASDNAMDDFDWLYGYQGFDSWSHWSHSEDTRLDRFIQLDISAAARILQAGPFEISALAGYRFLTLKMNAYGGSYIYSSSGGFRDLTGNFDPDRLGIAYQQWWHTPYVGFGARYTAHAWAVSAEVIGSPFVRSHDKDHHNLRDLVFEEHFSPDWMVGAALGVEYALGERVSLTGRAEYQKYFEAKGSTKMKSATGQIRHIPEPSAGGDINTLALTVGLKAGF